MNQISGMGGYSSSGKWRKGSLNRKGKKALTAIEPDDQQTETLLSAHKDTDALRRFGEKLRKKKGIDRETRAQFDLDAETGQIYLKIYDADTGEVQLKLTPEEVANGLKNLEEADGVDAPLSNFFVDLKV
ncbi:MAG: hypothetical protein JWQ35_502 [Bacteriovoracaceae bacterium]|nr:hypothetical protein [Bacteriovoracaceae bacterium]